MGFINTYINGCLPPINSFNSRSCSSSCSESSSNTCINNVYSLINYSYTFSPSSIGLVRYSNINITDSSVGNRIWNFTFGGYLDLTHAPYQFTIQYTFSPTCSVPNGINKATLNQINFNALNGDGTHEPLQGFIIVNNVNIPLSDAFSSPNDPKDPLATFSWDQVNTIFDLKLDLNKYIASPSNPNPTYNINYDSSSTAKNSIFANLWIQDSGSSTQLEIGSPNSLKISSITYTLGYKQGSSTPTLSMTVGSCTFYLYVTLYSQITQYTIPFTSNNGWATSGQDCDSYYNSNLYVINTVTLMNNVYFNTFTLTEN